MAAVVAERASRGSDRSVSPMGGNRSRPGSQLAEGVLFSPPLSHSLSAVGAGTGAGAGTGTKTEGIIGVSPGRLSALFSAPPTGQSQPLLSAESLDQERDLAAADSGSGPPPVSAELHSVLLAENPSEDPPLSLSLPHPQRSKPSAPPCGNPRLARTISLWLPRAEAGSTPQRNAAEGERPFEEGLADRFLTLPGSSQRALLLSLFQDAHPQVPLISFVDLLASLDAPSSSASLSTPSLIPNAPPSPESPSRSYQAPASPASLPLLVSFPSSPRVSELEATLRQRALQQDALHRQQLQDFEAQLSAAHLSIEELRCQLSEALSAPSPAPPPLAAAPAPSLASPVMDRSANETLAIRAELNSFSGELEKRDNAYQELLNELQAATKARTEALAAANHLKEQLDHLEKQRRHFEEEKLKTIAALTDQLTLTQSAFRKYREKHQPAAPITATTASPALDFQAQHQRLITEKDHLVAENLRLQEENARLKAQQPQQQQQHGHDNPIQTQLEQCLQEQTTQVSGLQEELAVITQRLAQAEEAHQVAVAASERASADRDALAEELSSLRLLGDAHAVDLEAEKARLTQQLQEYQQQQEQSHQLEHRHQQEKQQESGNMAELQSKFDTVSAENESLLARVALLNEAGIQSQTALSTLQDQNEALNLELAELKTRTCTLGDANTSLAAAQLSDLQEQLAVTNQRLSQAEEAHQAAIAFAERASADRDALSEELSSLRLLSDSHEIATSSPALEQLQAQHDLLIAEKGHLLGEKDHLVAENQRLQEENSLLEAQQQQQQQSGHGAEHLLIQNQLEQRLQEQAAQLSGLQEQLAVTSQRLVLAEAAAADHSESDPAALAEDVRHAVATTTSPAVVTSTPPSPAIASTLPVVEPSRSQYEQVVSEKKVLRDIPLFTPPRPLPPTTTKQSPAKSNARKPASNSYRRDPSQPQQLPSPVQIQTELNLVLSKLSDTQVEAKTALDQLRVLKESLDMLTKDNLKKDILIKNYAVQANTGKLHSPDQALLQHQASGISSWFGSSHSAPSTIDPKSSDSGLMSALQNAMVKNIQDRDAIKGLSEDLERLVGENKALKTIITQLSQPSPTNA